jgi:DENN domain-containing protein 11
MHGDDYAGISAFINKSNEQWERNALMLAVGALVPLEQGRLGRSWKHASKLKDIAKSAL